MKPLTKRWIACIALGLGFLMRPAAAQDAAGDYDADAGAPARIRALEGQATLERDADHDRLQATLNAPVYPGDRILTENEPLELQLPDGSLVWVAGDSIVELVALEGSDSQQETVVKLAEGTLETRIEAAQSGESAMRIDTTESSVYLMSRGRFRIESSHGVTTVTSYRGVAELAGDEGSTLIRSGQQSRVQSGAAAEDAWAVNTLRLDSFGEWCEERESSYVTDSEDQEQHEVVSQVPRPVRHYVTELDYYGDWQFIGSYGWVWRPASIQVGWRPYYSGYWCWRPGGWTWVSYEPWGWLPYHYGRWSFVATTGWVWIPGAVYSGAWVSWSVTPTYVGWCPLDYYNRPAYVRVNYTNVTVNQYGGGWNFLPLNRWGERNLSRDIVRADRVPQLQGAVTTRSMPRFDARQAKASPESVQRIVRDAPVRHEAVLSSAPTGDSSPSAGLSFREADRRERAMARQSEVRSLRQDKPGKILQVPEGTSRVPAGPRDKSTSVETFRPRRPAGSAAQPPAAGIAREPRSVPPKDSAPREPRAVPPPRVRSNSDDPSRRVLDRILRDGSAAQPSEEARVMPPANRGRPDSPPNNNGRPGAGRETMRRPNQPQAGRQPDGKPLPPPSTRREPPQVKKPDDGKKKDKP